MKDFDRMKRYKCPKCKRQYVSWPYCTHHHPPIKCIDNGLNDESNKNLGNPNQHDNPPNPPLPHYDHISGKWVND